MHLRTTLLLVVIAVTVGVVVLVNPFSGDDDDAPDPPWFYQTSMDDIDSIQVRFEGKDVKFVRTGRDGWLFTDPEDITPDPVRWGGMTLLLSGPSTRRLLRDEIDDPASYGLINPRVVIDVEMVGGRHVQVKLGNPTADGGAHYGQVTGFPQLFLVDATWGNVLTRLASDPPLPKWAVVRTVLSITELNLYDGDPSSEDTPVLRFTQERDGGPWTVHDFTKDVDGNPADDAERPVDLEEWEKYTPLLSGPPGVKAVVPRVTDRDYAKWGLTQESRAIEIRFAEISQRGSRFIDGVLISIGDMTPDGKGYYGKNINSEYSIQPVLYLDKVWVDSLLGLFDRIPYGNEEDSG